MTLKIGKSKRLSGLENGEIDSQSAFQMEIRCSFPELFDASEELAIKLNRDMGFLKIATPTMTINEWAHEVNRLKDAYMIPGQIRQGHLFWNGQDIVDLMRNLRILQMYGTVNMNDLPGYHVEHPAVLTCDAAGHCLLDDTIHGRQIAQYTGRIVHVDQIEGYEALAQKKLRYPMMTPATISRAGYELHGIENMPDRTEVRQIIPEGGHATLRTRCIYCGTLVRVRGSIRDDKPYYEVLTEPYCPHLTLRVRQYPKGNGEFTNRLHVRHEQDPPRARANRKAEAEKRQRLDKLQNNTSPADD
jgi:hypothetical protein